MERRWPKPIRCVWRGQELGLPNPLETRPWVSDITAIYTSEKNWVLLCSDHNCALVLPLEYTVCNLLWFYRNPQLDILKWLNLKAFEFFFKTVQFLKLCYVLGQAWQYTPLIPALRQQRPAWSTQWVPEQLGLTLSQKRLFYFVTITLTWLLGDKCTRKGSMWTVMCVCVKEMRGQSCYFFLSLWHNLELRRDSRLRKCPIRLSCKQICVCMGGIFLIDNRHSRAQTAMGSVTQGRQSGVYKKSNWASQEKQASRHHSSKASASVPALTLRFGFPQ